MIEELTARSDEKTQRWQTIGRPWFDPRRDCAMFSRLIRLSALPSVFMKRKFLDNGLEAPCREHRWRSPGSNLRHQIASPIGSTVLYISYLFIYFYLRDIDSAKSPSTMVHWWTFYQHGRPRRMVTWTFEGNTDRTVRWDFGWVNFGTIRGVLPIG